MVKKTLVIGASNKVNRYSYIAVKRLLEMGHEVLAIGAKEAEVNGVRIVMTMPDFEDVHTVTLYLNPKRQLAYYNYIISLMPKRVIFNPGTENDEFERVLRENGIETEQACTLVLLSTNQY